MAKRGGFGGGMPANMGNMMKQVQKMQKQMEETKKALDEKVYEAKAGGGAIAVTMNGKKELLSVKLQEDVVDPDDIETLEELVMAAVNEVIRAVEADAAKSMGALGGGMGLGF